MSFNVEAVRTAPQKAQKAVVVAPQQTTSVTINKDAQEKKADGISSENKLWLTLGGLALAGIGIYIACRKGNASTANKAATTAVGSVGDSVPKAETIMQKTATDKIAEKYSNKLTDASKVKFDENGIAKQGDELFTGMIRQENGDIFSFTKGKRTSELWGDGTRVRHIKDGGVRVIDGKPKDVIAFLNNENALLSATEGDFRRIAEHPKFNEIVKDVEEGGMFSNYKKDEISKIIKSKPNELFKLDNLKDGIYCQSGELFVVRGGKVTAQCGNGRKILFNEGTFPTKSQALINELSTVTDDKFVEKASEKGISYIREIGRKSGRTVISKYSDGQEVGRIIKKDGNIAVCIPNNCTELFDRKYSYMIFE